MNLAFRPAPRLRHEPFRISELTALKRNDPASKANLCWFPNSVSDKPKPCIPAAVRLAVKQRVFKDSPMDGEDAAHSVTARSIRTVMPSPVVTQRAETSSQWLSSSTAPTLISKSFIGLIKLSISRLRLSGRLAWICSEYGPAMPPAF